MKKQKGKKLANKITQLVNVNDQLQSSKNTAENAVTKDSLDDLIGTMRNLKKKGKSTVVFIGAGASITAGIPLAKGIIKDLNNKDNPFNCYVKNITTDDYGDFMKAIPSGFRKELFEDYIKSSKLNFAHLYLASLVKAGYVDLIVTVNFDNLVLKALSLFQIYPAVYDVASSKDFITSSMSTPAIVYLHGQAGGFWQLNTPVEVSLPVDTIKSALEDFTKDRAWIVSGYSGNDPVIKQFGKVIKFDYGLYWICFKDHNPIESVQKALLEDTIKDVYLKKGYDSDTFFRDLHSGLNIGDIPIISKPFTYLKNTIDELIKDKTILEDIIVDITKRTKMQVQDAIDVFEKGKPCDSTKTFKTKSRNTTEELNSEIRDIWLNKKYKELDRLYDFVFKSKNKKAKEYLAYAFFDYGLVLYNDKEFDKAIICFNKSIKLNPRYENAFSGRALLYSLKEMHIEEIADLNKAIELNPNNDKNYYNRGLAYSDIGDADKALDDFNKAIKLNPNYFEAYNNKGIIYSNKYDYDHAIKNFNKSIELNPNSDIAFNNRGLSYAKKEEYRKAILDFSKAIELNKSNNESYYNRGLALFLQHEYDNALEDLNRAIEMNTLHSGARLSRGLIFLKRENFIKSIDDFNKAIELEPNNAHSYFSRGSAYNALGEFENAITDYEKAIEINQDHIFAHLELIEVYMFTRKYNKALIYIDKAYKLNPTLDTSLILAYLNCIVLKLTDKDTSHIEKEINYLLKEVNKLSWSFKSFDSWLKKLWTTKEKKEYIITLTEKLKAKVQV